MDKKPDNGTSSSFGSGYYSSSSYSISRQTRVVLSVMGFVTAASGLAIGLSRIGLRSATDSAAAGGTAAASTTTLRSQQQDHHHRYRILAFGDSLTAGYVGGDAPQMYPYAKTLREALVAVLDADTDGDTPEVIVDHVGKPGWTSESLYGILPNELKYDVMIILAGTNDLGMGKSIETIVSNLKNLHEAALRRGANQTMALAIPSSAYQEHYINAKEMAGAINRAMQQWDNPKIVYVPFPFPYDRHDPRWHLDGLHLTEAGYNALGQYLAPLVYRELQQQQQVAA